MCRITLEDEKKNYSIFTPKCVRMSVRKKEMIYLLNLIFFFDLSQAVPKQKLLGVGVKRGQHLRPPCDASPAKGRQADETRSNTNTKRVSSVFPDNNQTET